MFDSHVFMTFINICISILCKQLLRVNIGEIVEIRLSDDINKKIK